MLKKFIDYKGNQIIINKKESDKNVIIVDRGRYIAALQSCLIAAAINRKYKYNVKVLTSKKKDDLIIDFYKSFGIEDFIYGVNIGSFIKNIYKFILSFINFIKSGLIISCHSMDWFVNKFEIKGIKVGDLIYDSYIRKKQRYLKPKKDFFFYYLLFRTIFKVVKILNLVKTINIKFVIISTMSYANNDAIFCRIAIKQKIKVLEAVTFEKKSSILEYDNNDLKYGPRSIHFDKIQRKKLNDIKLSKNFLNKFIKNRFESKIKFIHQKNDDVKIANKTKVKLSRNDFLIKFAPKKKYKKIIIFAPHAFSDAPHAVGHDICFRDFYSHFTETIDRIVNLKNKDVLWIVRPHPLSNFYGEKNVVENYLKKFNQKNLILCPKGLSTKNLLEICDTVITLKGVIGLELASIGKKSITCGYPLYSNFGISFEVNSKNKYFKILNKAHKINYKLPKKKELLAKKLLYYMELVIPYKTMESSQNFTDLIKDIYTDTDKSDLTWKKVLNRLKKNGGFLNDNFYLDCLKKL